MAKLIATRGLPGSGKTYWARQQLFAAEPGALVRVNRDDLRRMMLPAWYREPVREVERVLTVARDAAVRALLEAGVSVIADDTNLRPAYLDHLARLARDAGATWRVQDFLHVPLGLCIARDARRTGVQRVGEDVIRAMHDRHVAELPGS